MNRNDPPTIDDRVSIAERTLAELAVLHPAASRVFHRHGLDYCCGGKRALEAVCHEKGLDAAVIRAEILSEESRSTDRVAWSERPLEELVTFIVTRYHQSLRTELPDLIALAEKVETRHGNKASCPRGLAAHLRQVHEAVLEHLAKEEQVLFPLISAGHGSRANGPVQAMEHEHREHAVNLRRIRELTQDLVPPPEACTSWRALYLRLDQLEAELMEHIHLENNVLFPRALCD
jgi:regulator of cell morphogenesis and NO signaling